MLRQGPVWLLFSLRPLQLAATSITPSGEKSSSVGKSKRSGKLKRKQRSSVPHHRAKKNAMKMMEAHDEGEAGDHATYKEVDGTPAVPPSSSELLRARPIVSWDSTSLDGASSLPNIELSPIPSRPPASVSKTLVSILSERQQVHRAVDDGLESALKHESAIRIERRRSRPTLADTELDVGMSERLFPNMPRLTALSEVHHSDCCVQCWDEELFVQQQQHTTAVGGSSEAAVECVATTSSTLEGSLDSENLLLHDDDEGGDDAATSTSTSEAKMKTQTPSDALEHSTQTPPSLLPIQKETTSEAAARVRVVPSLAKYLGGSPCATLRPIPPKDVALLYIFLRRLRGATEAELDEIKVWYRRDRSNVEHGAIQDSNATAYPTRMEDVLAYLHGDRDGGIAAAPSPVLPFSIAARESVVAPAFTFSLYTENTSTQNAIAHIASLFSVPEHRFLSCHAASKMTNSTVLCAVQSNVVLREQLLLLNTMRHPGFVLRVCDINEVEATVSDTELFAELSQAPVLTNVSMVLRRVSGGSVAEISKRLDALRDVGAIFYCANRETSLVRAATDVLHGYYRSALLNCLFRRKAPIELREFLSRPSVSAADKARKVVNDSSIRQLLKGFIRSNGNFQAAVQQAPYVLRRKWINALRSHVWNVMASERLRVARREGLDLRVMVGDLILKPQFRQDAALRMMPNVKAEHLMVCQTEADAEGATLEDVYIPFFRGRFPDALFAPESSGHPIMTESAMQRVLRRLHAHQLLSGMPDDVKRVLDIRSDVSPMLFRRLLVRPCKADFQVLEDKVAMRSVHYDAARQLLSPRLSLQGIPPSTPPTSDRAATCVGGAALVDRTFILEATTFGATKSSSAAVMDSTLSNPKVVTQPSSSSDTTPVSNVADAFFATPSKEDYVVLGRAHRDLGAGFVPRAPIAADVGAFDRLYTVYIWAVCPNGASALTSMLREYFNLGGILDESASVLQHKIHRTRRELDVETPHLCAPRFCTACFNTCHDDLNACPEYLLKASIRQEKTLRLRALSSSGMLPPPPVAITPPPSSLLKGGTWSDVEVHITVRRRTLTAKWGIDLTKALQWTSVKDGGQSITRIALSGPVRTSADVAALRQYLAGGSATQEEAALLLGVLSSLAVDNDDVPVALAQGKAALRLDDEPSTLAMLKLQLVAVNGTKVATTRDVAAQFLHHKHALSITLAFRPGLLSQKRDGPVVVEGQLENTADGQLEVRAPPVVTLDATQASLVAELPTEMTLVLTKSAMGSSSPWGLEVSRTTLALNNIAALLSGNSGDVSCTAIPPVTSDALRRLVEEHPRLYKIEGVNHQHVQTIGDVAAASAQQQQVEGSSSGARTLIILLRKTLEGVQLSPVAIASSEPASVPTLADAPSATATVPMGPIDMLRTHHPDAALPGSPSVGDVHHFTVAVHRRGSDRWGIRLEAGTLRLKSIPPTASEVQGGSTEDQHRQEVSDVIAASPGVARSIADVLQRTSASNWLPYAFFITGVDQEHVATNRDLTEILKSKHQSDSITLQCVRVSLPKLIIDGIRSPPPPRHNGGGDQRGGVSWGLRLRTTDATFMSINQHLPCGCRLREILDGLRLRASPSAGPLPGKQIDCFPSLLALMGNAPSTSSFPEMTRDSALPAEPVRNVLLMDDDDACCSAPSQRATEGSDSGRGLFRWWAEAQCSPEMLRWELASVRFVEAGSGDDRKDGQWFPIGRSTREAARVLGNACDREGGTLVSFEIQELVET